MEYSKIIAVSGMPGLHELISSKNDGAIVRSLDDKSTRFVSSRIHNFSHLESIEIYTVRDNVNLVDILQAMEASKTAIPDVKDNASVKKYFEQVYPDLDFDRVYSSDMKKIVKWFDILRENKIEIKRSEAAPEETESEEEVPEEAEKPSKKAAGKPAPAETLEAGESAKKKAAPKKKAAVTEEADEKPAKRAAPKAKKADTTDEAPAPKKKTAPKKK